MGGELPGITRSIIEISQHAPLFLTLSGGLIILFIMLFVVYGKEEWFRKASSGVLLKIPVAGNLLKKHYEAQFCKLLFLLVSSEVPLLKSLQMLESIIVFYPYSKSFQSIGKGLRRGEAFF
ncbi:MAG: hypothetical protein AB2L24_23775 [Mangrovibacterium sp.]